MDITVTGATKNSTSATEIVVEGLQKATIAITFDDKTGKVTQIKFNGRPPLTTSYLKNHPIQTGEARCHRRSIEWIQAQIQKEFIGKNYAELTAMKSQYSAINEAIPEKEFATQARFHLSFNPSASQSQKFNEKCERVAQSIGEIYLDRARDETNLFIGDAKHNNFAGKLVYLLKPYILSGQEALSFPLIISIPMKHVGKDPDFYAVVKSELRTSSLVIDSWDELLNFYFCINYDESEKPKKRPSFLDQFTQPRITSSSTRPAWPSARLAQAQRVFLYTYDTRPLQNENPQAALDDEDHSTSPPPAKRAKQK